MKSSPKKTKWARYIATFLGTGFSAIYLFYCITRDVFNPSFTDPKTRLSTLAIIGLAAVLTAVFCLICYEIGNLRGRRFGREEEKNKHQQEKDMLGNIPDIMREITQELEHSCKDDKS